jgi:hypothetical protein
MSHVRSIALCDESYIIAQKKGNLSHWVRVQLLRDNAPHDGIHTGMRREAPTGLLCNPMGNMSQCPLCWPYGKPTIEDWAYYRNMIDTNPAKSKEYENIILEQARLNNPHNLDLPYTSEPKVVKSIKKKKSKKGFLHRLNRAIGIIFLR